MFIMISVFRHRLSSAKHWQRLRSGKYDGQQVAVGMGKYVGDCRLTHYGALLRKALDDAGYEDVPVLDQR